MKNSKSNLIRIYFIIVVIYAFVSIQSILKYIESLIVKSVIARWWDSEAIELILEKFSPYW